MTVTACHEITVSVVQCRDLLLVLERRLDKRFDPGLWEFVSGFCKGERPLVEQARSQVTYETQLSASLVRAGRRFDVRDHQGLWTIHPFLFSTADPQVTVRPSDHVGHRWIDIGELDDLPCVIGLQLNLHHLDVV